MRQTILVAALAVGFAAGSARVLGTSVVEGNQLASSTVDVPRGAMVLGSVNIPRRVMANGQTLAAGSYDVQLTAESASPETVGALAVLERWVEFRQGDDVKGREVVTIVPAVEIGDVAESAAPGRGSSRVEILKENEYVRVWINQDGTHYLIHLVLG